MKVLFRADASDKLGFGHIARCLTLAEALQSTGVTCAFACRALPGDAIELLLSNHFDVYRLREDTEVEQTLQIVNDLDVDWLVVDHYGLDHEFEAKFGDRGIKVLVIDDLADRSHDADALLDQNLGQVADAYRDLVPQRCNVLIGPRYALLRPQFSALRLTQSRADKQSTSKQVLITMGGTDPANATGQILTFLAAQPELLGTLHSITVIMGSTAKWLDDVEAIAYSYPVPVQIKVAVSDMAREMIAADIAIGAGGTTSWERCCLGLPSVVFALADNQKPIARALDFHGAARFVGDIDSEDWKDRLVTSLRDLLTDSSQLTAMSDRAYALVDGRGTARLASEVFGVQPDWPGTKGRSVEDNGNDNPGYDD